MNGEIPEDSKRACEVVAMIIVIVAVIVICGLVYMANQAINLGVEILDEGARQLKTYTEKRSREFEKLQREIDRLDRY